MNEFESKMIDGMARVETHWEDTAKSLDTLSGEFKGLRGEVQKVTTDTAVNTQRIGAVEKDNGQQWKKIRGLCRPRRRMVLTAGGVAAVISLLIVLAKELLAFFT